MDTLNYMLGSVLGFVWLSGCASTPAPVDDATSLASSMQRTKAGEVLSRLTNVDNGLEVRRWIAEGDSSRLGAVLMKHAIDSPIPPDVLEDYRRNGLRMVTVPKAALETLAEELGPLTLNLNEWHGQVDDWRTLHERSLPGSGQVVAVNGRVRAYPRGRFQLMVRSWVVPMEDRPFLHLDLVPCFTLGAAPRGSMLVPDETRRGERYDRLSLSLRIDPDVAYVLTSESPRVQWPGESPAPGDSRPVNGSRRRIGPGLDPGPSSGANPPDSMGPDAVAPTTLGTLLLGGDSEPVARGLLVFVPRVAPEVFPPSTPLVTSAGTGTNP